MLAASNAQKCLWLGLIFAALAALPPPIGVGLLMRLRWSAVTKLPDWKQWIVVFRIVFGASAAALLLAALVLYLR
jgi:hypothetical protein